MAMLRLLALGLLCGVIAVPLFWRPRGEGFEHARLEALTTLLFGQFLLVPLALLIGAVLTAGRTWTRPPGYVLGAVAAVFGAIVVIQGRATMAWTDTRPAGIGDPDGEHVLAMFASVSGMVTIAVGVCIVLLRWAGYDGQAAPARGARRRGSRTDPSGRTPPR